jgi:hypothetical protein
MNRKLDKVVASIAGNRELVDTLDQILTGPDDRAYIVCLAEECRNNLHGTCSIHTVKSRRELLDNGRCRDYVT